jgi:hypothetical protein
MPNADLVSREELEPAPGLPPEGATRGSTPAGKGQVARVIIENGPDPRQSEWWDGLADRTAGELSSQAAPESVRWGMKGSPEVTWYGDPGPLGGVPSPSYGAPNAFPALNAPQALPNTSSPAVTPQTIKSILGEFD